MKKKQDCSRSIARLATDSMDAVKPGEMMAFSFSRGLLPTVLLPGNIGLVSRCIYGHLGRAGASLHYSDNLL